MSKDDETIRTGVQIRREMFGSEATDQQIAQASAFTRPMQGIDLNTLQATP